MPDIILDVLVEAVDISTVIEVDIGDLTEIKPTVKDVQFRDVGHIDVSTVSLFDICECFLLPGWNHRFDPRTWQFCVADLESCGEYRQERLAEFGDAFVEVDANRGGEE